MKNGWIEKHEQQRISATLKAQFRRLDPSEARDLQTQASYRQTGLKQLAQLSRDSTLHRAITRDLFQSRLFLVGQNPLSAGERLEILLQLPQYRLPLGLLAEVAGVKTSTEMGNTLFHGALQVLAIHKDDVDRLSRHSLQQHSARPWGRT